MSTRTIKTVFQVRRDSTANWEKYKDIIPAAGEPCYDLDLKTLRIGDGDTAYENLPVIGGVAGADNLQSAIEKLQEQVGETNVVEIQDNITNLTTQIESTNTEIVTIHETLESKANTSAVIELQTTLEQKVDEEVVGALETELKTYIDEQIKTVESGNIDDGEI